MLKACFDCLAGATNNRSGQENGGAYGIRLNGDTQRAPPWPPQLDDQKMLLILPKPPQFGDKIYVAGQFRKGNNDTNWETMTLSLLKSDQNAIFDMIVEFSKDEIVIKNTYDDNETQGEPPSMLFNATSSWFEFHFTIRQSTYNAVIDIGRGTITDPHFSTIPFDEYSLNSIQYLSVTGVEKITKLQFEFA